MCGCPYGVGSKRMSELLADGAKQIGIGLSVEQLDQLNRMLDVLQLWNQKHNLTSLRSRHDQEIYHVLDSLSAYQYFIPYSSILDVGTGAGFPGIPLAIIYPEKKFHLVESNGKKVAYLRHVIQQLGLDNVKVYNKRIELFSMPNDTVDVVTARALANPIEIMDLTQHLQVAAYVLYVGPNCKIPPSASLEEVNVPHSTKEHFILSIVTNSSVE